MIRDRELEAIRVRNTWRITREQLQRYLAQQSRGTEPPVITDEDASQEESP
jgi:hypothetical protein